MGYTLKVDYANPKNYGGKRKATDIKYIVLHYTANDGDHDESNAKYFKSYRGASAHYFVDDDSATISVPDLYVAYSVGGSRYSNYKQTGGATMYKKITNKNSISIEMCDTKKDGKYAASEATLENAAELVVTLMKKYNIPIENVYRHFDVTGKACPSYWASKNNSGFLAFKERIKTLLGSKTGVVYLINGIDFSPVFNPEYYAKMNSDVVKALGSNPVTLWQHFCNCGCHEARIGSAEFNPKNYKNRYPDLAKAYGNDWVQYYVHYCKTGKAKGLNGK
jgi:hypothetical protein